MGAESIAIHVEMGICGIKILVINAGSSSLKYQLIDSVTQEMSAKGLSACIGIDGRMKHTPANGKAIFDADVPVPTYVEAIARLLELLVSANYGVIATVDEISVVGYWVVHGGEWFKESVLIDEEVMSAIRACVPLAPLHNPSNIMGIEACQNAIPGAPMVAVFDTAFHRTCRPGYATIPSPMSITATIKVVALPLHFNAPLLP